MRLRRGLFVLLVTLSSIAVSASPAHANPCGAGQGFRTEGANPSLIPTSHRHILNGFATPWSPPTITSQANWASAFVRPPGQANSWSVPGAEWPVGYCV